MKMWGKIYFFSYCNYICSFWSAFICTFVTHMLYFDINIYYSVILDVAAGVFDSANQLSNLGFTDQSAFLYENVSALF